MEIRTSTRSADAVSQELEHSWDIYQAAAFLGFSQAELRDHA